MFVYLRLIISISVEIVPHLIMASSIISLMAAKD